ncbi:unnamed protein product [Prunus armeniaca]|uniref:Integrase catalytic domain-containing protein n=1 Tax=Prunus armeniaca TaxID=36596 RepID=A0A6J5U0J8_PRUAR|nr:unnamed protein product [Prunus armeniaca]CAB4299373.1 unnamed protein product [Prunus armeniaca]
MVLTRAQPNTSLILKTLFAPLLIPIFITGLKRIRLVIHSSLSESILPYIVGSSTSRDLWLTLEKRFAAITISHLLQLKACIQNLKKGSLPMLDYLQLIKHTVDSLAAAGDPLDPTDFIAYILNNLPAEYDAFSTSIRVCFDLVDPEELHGLLLSEEMALDQRASLNNDSSAHAFHNSSQTNNKAFSFTTNSHPSSSTKRNSNKPFQSSNNSSSSSSFRPPYHPSNYVNSRIKCQIYNKPGHTAITCCIRHNHSYQGHAPSPRPTSYSPTTHNPIASYTSYPSIHPYHTSTWYANTRATNHVTHDLSSISMPSDYTGSEKVVVANGQTLDIHHSGNSILYSPSSKFSHKNILHTPHATHNLLSIHKFFNDNNCHHIFTLSACFVKDNLTGKILFRGHTEGGLYHIHLSSHKTSPSCLIITASPSLWHQRTGHPSAQILQQIISKNNLPVLGKFKDLSFCNSCPLGKQTKLPFLSTPCISRSPMELIHTDLWGPSPTPSLCGFHYYIIFINDYSKYCWLYPLLTKSAALTAFIQFKIHAKKLLDHKIRTLRCDNGGEFTNIAFQQFLIANGINQQFCYLHTPEQNGLAERKHRHIIELTRTLFAQSNLPLNYWVEIAQTLLMGAHVIPG